MKTTKIIFLRHADTEKDPNVNAAKWGLSENGKAQSEEVSKQPVMDTAEVIFVSEEQKTSLTVDPIAKKLNLTPIVIAEFNEVQRGDKFLTKEEFEAEKVKQLTDLSFNAFGGESANEALARFKKGIEKITQENEGKTILVVTHGTVLNLYFANLLNSNKLLPDRWSKTAFCAFGIVENGEVTKDIVAYTQA